MVCRDTHTHTHTHGIVCLTDEKISVSETLYDIWNYNTYTHTHTQTHTGWLQRVSEPSWPTIHFSADNSHTFHLLVHFAHDLLLSPLSLFTLCFLLSPRRSLHLFFFTSKSSFLTYWPLKCFRCWNCRHTLTVALVPLPLQMISGRGWPQKPTTGQVLFSLFINLLPELRLINDSWYELQPETLLLYCRLCEVEQRYTGSKLRLKKINV